MEHVILDRIAPRVKDDPVDGVLRKWIQVGRTHLVRFDQSQIQLDVRQQRRIACENREGLAVGRPCGAHGAQFFGETDGSGPLHEGQFDLPVGLRIGRE